MSVNKLVPRLRFPEFRDEWEVKKLGDMFYFSNTKVKVRQLRQDNYVGVDNLISDLGGKGKPQYLPNADSVTAYELGDILQSNIRPYLKKAWLASDSGGASADVLVMRPKVGILSKFLYFTTTTDKYFDYVMTGAKGVKMPRGDKAHIASMAVYVPIGLEQQKIADFLTAVDEKIAKLEQKQTSLETYKRGVMQQIFSQKIRFTKPDGSAYPDWQTKKLGEIIDVKKGQQLNRDELPGGKYPMINGGIEPSGFTDSYNTDKNSVTISEGGNSCGFVNFIESKFWSGGHCYTVDPKGQNPLFIFQIIKYNEIDIKRLRVGSGLPNIQRKDLLRFKIVFTTNEDEQQQIANFFSAIDSKIQLNNDIMQKAKQFKKSLLQRMFV